MITFCQHDVFFFFFTRLDFLSNFLPDLGFSMKIIISEKKNSFGLGLCLCQVVVDMSAKKEKPFWLGVRYCDRIKCLATTLQ
jgi:hypothetical protein